MKNKKKDNIIKLCFKYSFSCKSCPRNRRCEEEEEQEIRGDLYAKYEARKIRTKSNKRDESKRSI